MIPLRFGDVHVRLYKGATVTIFPDGKVLMGFHREGLGQAETAQRLGYGSDVEGMNRDHDIAHCIFAYQMGLPYSGSLYSAARYVKPTSENFLEESAVLAMQAFAKSQGVDLILIARKITAESDGYKN